MLAVVVWIGKILLFTLLGLLALIILLLLIFSAADLTVRVRFWAGETAVSAGAWPVLIPLYPGRKKPEKEKADGQKPKKQRRKKAVQKAEEEIQKSPGDLKKTIGTLIDLAAAFLPPVGGILKGIKVRRLTLHIQVGGRDAADTAIRYGQVNAILHGSLGTASSLIDIKTRYLGVSYDFLARKDTIYLEADLRLRGARVLWEGVRGLGRFVVRLLKKTVRKKSAPVE